MSQLLLLSSKTTSSLVNQAISAGHRTVASATPFSTANPLTQLKLCNQIHTQTVTYFNRQKLASTYQQRITNNASKIYARRVLLLASLSASSMAKKTRLEGEFIPKPAEWKTVDLVQQRKEFGENISSLGSSRVSRVWAAGKSTCMGSMNICDYYWNRDIHDFFFDLLNCQ